MVDAPEKTLVFYLGTHMTTWLSRLEGIPLFVSRRTLHGRKSAYPKATCGRWALDSGGYTELNKYGKWMTPPEQYVDEVRRFSSEIGSMDFAACQDWMTEPHVRAKTGLSIEEHQRRTLASYVQLLDMAPEQPWLPVLQGWAIDDYLSHLRMYEDAGIDLRSLEVVGVGSVCRREATEQIKVLMDILSHEGLSLHGFGVKKGGIKKARRFLASADSMAWSLGAYYSPEKLGAPGCRETHKNCANCLAYALAWRADIIKALSTPLPPSQREFFR